MDVSPFLISLKIALLSTVLSFIIGIILARIVTKMQRGKALLDSLLTIPLVLPPTVVGILLLMFLGKNSALGSFLRTMGIRIIFTWQAGIIAAFVVSFPLMFRTLRGAIEQVDGEMINAARTLGMKEGKIFRKIIFPNAWPGIAAAIVLTFARALGEFGATMMVAGNIPGKTQTMAVAVYSLMQSGKTEEAYKWVVIIIVYSVTMLTAMNLWIEYYRKKKL